MNRLVCLFLLVAWLIGVISGHVPAKLDSGIATENSYIVTESDWGRLAVRSGEIALQVGFGGAYWQMTISAPASVHALFCNDVRAAPPDKNFAPERARFIPF